MKKLVFHVAAGAAALVLLDYVAIGNSAAVSAVSPAGEQSVNRLTKGDRQDRGGTSVQLKLVPAPQTTPAPAPQETPQPAKQETKLLEGCELAVSPLAESASSRLPARCMS
jgi:hypothetical protein